MNIKKIVSILFVCLFLGLAVTAVVNPGFFNIAGGPGGTVHAVPAQGFLGQPIPITIEFRTLGSRKGSKVWTDVQCHFRPVGSVEWKPIQMPLIREEGRGTYHAIDLPPVTDPAIDAIEYYITYKVDRRPGSRGTPVEPHRIPILAAPESEAMPGDAPVTD